jgi:hypothetical protein
MVMTTDSEQDKKREIANKIAKKREEGKSDEQIGIEMTDDFLAELGILRDSGRRKLNPCTGEWEIVWELTENGRELGQDILDAVNKPKN